jgi:aerobic C4-dicarboxylate transport protein
MRLVQHRRNKYLPDARSHLSGAADEHPFVLRPDFGDPSIALFASKGGSGVTGTGFVTLAAILAAIPSIPVQSLALLVGIEKFMSECHALTNVCGNGVATLVVSRWQREFDSEMLRAQPGENRSSTNQVTST